MQPIRCISLSKNKKEIHAAMHITGATRASFLSSLFFSDHPSPDPLRGTKSPHTCTCVLLWLYLKHFLVAPEDTVINTLFMGGGPTLIFTHRDQNCYWIGLDWIVPGCLALCPSATSDLSIMGISSFIGILLLGLWFQPSQALRCASASSRMHPATKGAWLLMAGLCAILAEA